MGKYNEGERFTIQNINGIDDLRWYDSECMYTGKNLEVRQLVTLQYSDDPDAEYTLCIDGMVSQDFTEEEINILTKGVRVRPDTSYTEPSLGVMPKKMYEVNRVEDLCRALYDRSIQEPVEDNVNIMHTWAEELVDRLWDLQNLIDEESNK